MRRERSQNVIICLSSHLFDLLWSLGPSPSRQKGFRSQGPSCPVDEQPQWPSGLPLSASAGTASLLPVSWGSSFPGAMAKDSSRTWPFQCCSRLTSTLSRRTLAVVLPLGSCVTSDSPIVSTVASLRLQAGAGNGNHCARAGPRASTTITKGALQGRARRLEASSKAGVRNTPKELLPQKDFCSSGDLHGDKLRVPGGSVRDQGLEKDLPSWLHMSMQTATAL